MLSQRLQTARILWGALLMSVGIYGVVLATIQLPAPSAPPQPMFPAIFGALALSIAIVSFFVPSLMLKQGLRGLNLPLGDVPDPNAPEAFNKTERTFLDPDKAVLAAFPVFQTGLILSCALSEAVALLGFVLGFLGHGTIVAAPFFVVGALLIAVRFPSEGKVRSALETAYGVKFPKGR